MTKQPPTVWARGTAPSTKPISRDGQLIPVCPYCRVEAELQYTAYGRRWECPATGCDARVGVHKDSPRGAPLGTLARAGLREQRRKVHEVFDPLWRDKPPRFPNRQAAYGWLASHLGIAVARCHVGEFDERLCALAITAVSEFMEVPR